MYGAILALQLFFIIHGFSGMPDLVGKAFLITLATPYIIYVIFKEISFITKGPNEIIINTDDSTANIDGQKTALSEDRNFVIVENSRPFYTLTLAGNKISGYYFLENEIFDLHENNFLHVVKRK